MLIAQTCMKGKDMTHEFVFPDVSTSLIAILGLLVIWQYYRLQVAAGRILAVDLFDRSGTRMYVYALPADENACETCSDANGVVLFPSQVARNRFSPIKGECRRTTPCTGVLVGLYGGWLEARGILERLRKNRGKEETRLSPEHLRALVNGQWERSISADTDRLGIKVLEGMSYEKINPDVSMGCYIYLLDQVKEVRHLMLLVPTYLRLTELLIKHGRHDQAIEIIERFEDRFPSSKRGPHFPSDTQREAMKSKKAQALKGQHLKATA